MKQGAGAIRRVQDRAEDPPTPAGDRSPLRRPGLFAGVVREEDPMEDDTFAGLGAEALSEAARESVVKLALKVMASGRRPRDRRLRRARVVPARRRWPRAGVVVGRYALGAAGDQSGCEAAVRGHRPRVALDLRNREGSASARAGALGRGHRLGSGRGCAVVDVRSSALGMLVR